MDLSITKIDRLDEHCQQVVNLLGIVVGFKEIKRSKGNDYVFNVSLSDDTCSNYHRFIIVNVFRPHLQDFPPISEKGCILFLRGIKVCKFENILTGVSNFKYAYALFTPENNVLKLSSFLSKLSVTDELINAANELYQNYCSLFYPANPIPSSTTANPLRTAKYSNSKALEELKEDDSYFDFYGEILSISPTKFTNCVHVISTDYTENHLIVQSDKEALNINGISDEMTILVKFWDSNASIIQEGRRGDLIYCRKMNLRITEKSSEVTFNLRNLYDKKAYEIMAHNSLQHPSINELLSRKERIFFSKSRKMDDQTIKSNLDIPNKKYNLIIPSKINTENSVNIETNSDNIRNDLVVSKNNENYRNLNDIHLIYSRPLKFVSSFTIEEIIPYQLEAICCLFCSNCKIYHSDLCTECFECGVEFDFLSYSYKFAMKVIPFSSEEESCDRSKSFFVIVDYRAGNQLMNGIVPTNLRKDRYTFEIIRDYLEFLVKKRPLITSTLVHYNSVNTSESRLLLVAPISIRNQQI